MNSLALKIAWDVHKDQRRKGSNAPYIIHPIEVAVILTENGADDDLVTAGLLHDTLEDIVTGRQELFKLIKSNFSDRVLNIIIAVSEHEKISINRALTRSEKMSTWRSRKIEAINKLKSASLDVKMVSCADKLSNIRSMVEDYKTLNDKLWFMFNAGYDEQKWYYTEVLKALDDLKGYDMFKELEEKIGFLF
ncbi:MAG: HD domain-containing protein [Clostridiales bacterium]|nr:HD domain-containing protein [Clostridiales bacterium]